MMTVEQIESRALVQWAFLLAELECGEAGVFHLDTEDAFQVIRGLRDDFPGLVGERMENGWWMVWLPEEMP